MKTAPQTWTALLSGAMIATVAIWLLGWAPSPQLALAQVPDAGLQRQKMIDELRASNERLDEIARLLREIRDARPHEDKKPGASRPARGQP